MLSPLLAAYPDDIQGASGTSRRKLPAIKTLLEAAVYLFTTDETLEGCDRIYADDPFGNRLELMEPRSVESPQGKEVNAF